MSMVIRNCFGTEIDFLLNFTIAIDDKMVKESTAPHYQLGIAHKR